VSLRRKENESNLQIQCLLANSLHTCRVQFRSRHAQGEYTGQNINSSFNKKEGMCFRIPNPSSVFRFEFGRFRRHHSLCRHIIRSAKYFPISCTRRNTLSSHLPMHVKSSNLKAYGFERIECKIQDYGNSAVKCSSAFFFFGANDLQARQHDLMSFPRLCARLDSIPNSSFPSSRTSLSLSSVLFFRKGQHLCTRL